MTTTPCTPSRARAHLVDFVLGVTLILAACAVPPGQPSPSTTSAAPTSSEPITTASGPSSTVSSTTTTVSTGPIDFTGPWGGPRKPCVPPAVGTSFPPGLTCRNIDVDGYPRELLVYVPVALAAEPSQPAPMVFMFHGSSGNGLQFANISGWREKADAEGFIAVFPTGLEYFVTEDGKNRWNTKWNSFGLRQDVDLNKRLPGYPATSPWPADDTSFVQLMIQDIQAHHSIDATRIYVSGFSNGGAFAARLANDLVGTVAAVGTSGAPAPVWPPTLGEIPPGFRPVPLWQALGTEDDLIGSKHGVESFPLDHEVMLASPLGKLLGWNGMTYSGTETECDVSMTPNTTTVSWCEEGRPDYKFSMVKGMTHVYPHGYNKNTNPAGVVAADIFWEFFEQHPLEVR